MQLPTLWAAEGVGKNVFLFRNALGKCLTQAEASSRTFELHQWRRSENEKGAIMH